MRDTRIGLWVYSQFDKILDFVRDRYGWTWFDQPDDAWKKVNPKIGETVYDGAVGSAGFLCETYTWMRGQGELSAADYEQQRQGRYCVSVHHVGQMCEPLVGGCLKQRHQGSWAKRGVEE